MFRHRPVVTDLIFIFSNSVTNNRTFQISRTRPCVYLLCSFRYATDYSRASRGASRSNKYPLAARCKLLDQCIEVPVQMRQILLSDVLRSFPSASCFPERLFHEWSLQLAMPFVRNHWPQLVLV